MKRPAGPKVAVVYRQRGLTLSKLGRFPEEVAAFDAALKLAPSNTSLLFHRAVANTHAGNIDAAIADFGACIELDPKPKIYFWRGNLQMRQGRYESAISDYSHAIALDSKMVGAYGNRANSYYKLGKYDLALQDYSAALKLDVLVYRNRGILYEKQGRPDLARADYERGLLLLPNDSWFKGVLGKSQ